jgi:hypothetical protein
MSSFIDSRFTEEDLIEEIEQANQQLEEAGHDTRFILRPQYERQYVYAQSAKAVQAGSTSQGDKICSGTPSECSDVVWLKLNQLLRDHYRDLYAETYKLLVMHQEGLVKAEAELKRLKGEQS